MCCRKQEGTMIKAEHISYRIGNNNILQDINTELQPGVFNIILGPNGCGKSSLLKILSGYIPGFSGKVLYDGKNVKAIPTSEFAKCRAVMSQLPELSFPLSVDEVVMMGRYPHFLFNPGKKDIDICREVMQEMSLLELAERNYLSLSGGEKQRVQFARVLAQVWERPENGSRYLFLDEPVASLDIRFQHQFLQLAKRLAGTNTTVIAVLHDINLAMQYADRLIFMKKGSIVRQGVPGDIITAALIEEVFHVKVRLIREPGCRPIIVYDTMCNAAEL